MSESKHTPGPWATDPNCGHECVLAPNGAMVADCAIFGTSRTFRRRGGDNEANARLIAAAPDHALICWAMCVGAGRWEPFGDGKGEFCMNGLRHATELDEFGCPRVTESMRAALIKAGATP